MLWQTRLLFDYYWWQLMLEKEFLLCCFAYWLSHYVKMHIFSSARGLYERVELAFRGGGGGGGGALIILTACHWLTSRGGEAPRKIFFWFFTSVFFRFFFNFFLVLYQLQRRWTAAELPKVSWACSSFAYYDRQAWYLTTSGGLCSKEKFLLWYFAYWRRQYVKKFIFLLYYFITLYFITLLLYYFLTLLLYCFIVLLFYCIIT